MSVNDADDNLPLYRSLADQLRDRIERGDLAAGDKLPSLRDAAEEGGLSIGTVRHAYDLLFQEGLISLDQGRGTFVSSPELKDEESRKDAALFSIDEMLDSLAANGFSAQEAQIFFELRLRQRESMTRPVRIVVLADSPEERGILLRDLEKIQFAECYSMSLDDLIISPERIDYGPDFLSYPIPLERKLPELTLSQESYLPVSLSLTETSMVQLLRELPERRTGLMTISRSFMTVVRESLQSLFGREITGESFLFGDISATSDYISDKKVLLLPAHYHDLIDTDEAALLRQAARQGQKQITIEYKCDEGSLIFINRIVQERFRQLRALMR